ncbi:MAG: hemerythrin domain-containing protein [Chloroflexi bacterium]|nr:hemerythrin domain-containing protein [Chloroflexota bacterium]
MQDVLAMIDRIIEEHKRIIGDLQAMEKMANDLGAIGGLERAEGEFVPGRWEDHVQGLGRWKSALDVIERAISRHFHFEETFLMPAVERHGTSEMAPAWRVWLAEHAELRERLAKLGIDMDELKVAETHHVIWQGKAWGIRVYMVHTRKLFEIHASSEQELLQKMRSYLLGSLQGQTGAAETQS